MNIAQKVADVRDSLGLSQEEFAKRIGFSRNYVSRIETGKSKNPSRKFLRELEASQSEANAHKMAEKHVTYGASSLKGNVDPRKLELRKIPVYSFVQAGRATDFESFPESWEDEVGYLGGDPKAFGLRIVGDSMEPKFSPGDIVVVSPSHAPSNGDKVVANIRNQGVLFKVMHHSGDMKIIKLTSYNPVYPEIQIPREELHWMYPVKMVMKI
jgi:phage repressor protein C with HTH and peptisase S24 domain